MGTFVEEIIKGRKTFFVAPDKSRFPESYLEEYLTAGYECYFIETDLFLPISTKIEVILSVFKDCIMFFNIDASIQKENWQILIPRLQKKYPDALFGITYSKRQTLQEKASLEEFYLFKVGLKCGCIQLEYQKKNNFGIIEKALYANQAMGRRKNVRAVCGGSCTLKFVNSENISVIAKLSDISISHFSFTLNLHDNVKIQQYEKIKDIQFNIKGLHFTSDAVEFSSRETDTGILYVFAFTNPRGQAGLEESTKRLLIPRIYEIMSTNCQSLLTQLFNNITHKIQKTAE